MGVTDEVLKTNESYAKDFKCERANEDWGEPLDLGISPQGCGSPLSPVIVQFPDMQYLNADRRVILDRLL